MSVASPQASLPLLGAHGPFIEVPTDATRAPHAVATAVPAAADASPTAGDWVSEGFYIGWDYARHQLTPPADHLHEGHPVRQGWQLGRQRLAHRTLTPRPTVRLWLALRLNTWARGGRVDHPRLNPHYIAQLLPKYCPVTREELTLVPGQDNEAVVTALAAECGVVPGNLAVVSRRALRARAGRDLGALEALTATTQPMGDVDCVDGLNHAQWGRWLSLVRAVQATGPSVGDSLGRAHPAAAHHPLTALPPQRVRVSVPAWGAQAMVTCTFMGPAYARRMMDLAALLPTSAARRPYFLLMNALLARRMSAPVGADRDTLRQVMEDAWRHPIVVQRWQALLQVLRPAACDQWLRRSTERGAADAGLRWLAEGS